MLSNNGNSDVNITNVQLTGTEFSHNGTNVLLPRNSSVTWALSFSPESAGAKTGALTITTDSTPSTITVSLTGTGVVVDSGGDGSNDGGGSNNDTGSSDDRDSADDSEGSIGLMGGGFLFIGMMIWLAGYRMRRASSART
jgi:hypothetical protein